MDRVIHKVISISLDKKLLIAGSENEERQRTYSSLCQELHVIVFSKQKVSPRKVGDSLWIYSTGSRFKVFFVFDAIRIARSIGRPDLVSSQDPAFTGITAYLVAKMFRCRFQTQVHNDFYSPYFWQESFLNKVYVVLGRLILPKADCIRAVNENIRQYMTNHMDISDGRICVLPVYPDVHKFSTTVPRVDLHQKYPEFHFIIVMASRLVKQKNIDYAIAAIRMVVDRHPDVGLVIVGSGPEERSLKEHAARLGLQAHIRFESWTQDMISYLKTADLFLLTSYYEGFVRAGIEAMAAGCPVAMSDTTLAGDIFQSDVTCLTFPLHDAEQLAERLIYAIEHPEVLKKLAEQAKEKVMMLPTGDEYLAQYLRSWQNCFL